MNLFCVAVMSGISLCRMTERSNGRGGSCLLPLFICHLNMTYAVAWSSLFCTAIVLCYFQQLVTRWPPLCASVCVSAHCLSERCSAGSRGRRPREAERRWCHPTFLFVLFERSRTEGYWMLVKKKKNSHKHKQINVEEMYVYFAFYTVFFLMYEHSDCIWNY